MDVKVSLFLPSPLASFVLFEASFHYCALAHANILVYDHDYRDDHVHHVLVLLCVQFLPESC